MRASLVAYISLMAGVTLVALFASGRDDGVRGVVGLVISILFVASVIVVVTNTATLILAIQDDA